MFRRNLLAVSGLLAMVSITPAAWAGVSTLQQSVTVDQHAGDATFTIEFSSSPNFFTLDKAGRPQDSFEVDIAADPSGSNPLAFGNLTTIVHGGEIHIADTLPVRNAFPPSTDKAGGGWGSVRGTIPFKVTGDTLSFTTPLSLIGAPDGKFAYQAFTTHFGAETAAGSGVSVPLPSALMAGLGMLGAGIVVSAGRRLKKVDLTQSR